MRLLYGGATEKGVHSVNIPTVELSTQIRSDSPPSRRREGYSLASTPNCWREVRLLVTFCHAQQHQMERIPLVSTRRTPKSR